MTVAIPETHINKRKKKLHFINKNDLEKAENNFFYGVVFNTHEIFICILSPSHIIFIIIFRQFLFFFFFFFQINIINDCIASFNPNHYINDSTILSS
jgi:hypothetical protein